VFFSINKMYWELYNKKPPLQINGGRPLISY
jgi:hypothetical protein